MQEKTRELANQGANPKGSGDGDTEVDIENHVENDAVGGGGDGSLQGLLSGKPAVNKAISASNKEMLTAIGKRIQQVRSQYANIVKLCKNGGCYSRYCNMTPSPSSPTTGATKNNAQSLVCTCYSPVCLQRARLKRDLITLLRKANALNNNQSTVTNVSTLLSASPQLAVKTEIEDIAKGAIKRDLESTHCSEETIATNVDKKSNDIVTSPPLKRSKIEPSAEKGIADVTTVTTSNVSITTTTTTTITTTQQQKSADGMVQQQERSVTRNSVTVSSTETSTTSNDDVLRKRVIVNRRGRTVHRCAYRKELNPDGSEKIYTTTSTQGKVYLKKMAISDRKKKRTPVKYPLCSTFCTKNKHRSILLLPQHELRKLSRVGGRIPVQGFHHQAKANLSVWPYPCPRPLFKTCWLYRTVGLKSLAAAAIQLRILWACMRWDDMAAKPLSTDGKSQITTDTELVTLEILEHRHVGQFLDRTQYMRRKVVIPLELPKQVRGT